VANFCCPAIVITHPRLLGKVGYASNSLIIRRESVSPVREETVSSTWIELLNHITHLYIGPWSPRRTREQKREVVVAVEDHDQRCRTIVDGHVWLCGSIGPVFPKHSDVV